MTTLSNQADPCLGSSPDDWQTLLAKAVTDPRELCHLLDLPQALADAATRAARPFQLLVPRPFLERIRPGDPNDPLLRQVLPIGAESEVVEGFGPDPLCEADATPAPGLLSKYRGRSLIVTTGRCGVHCRFCFRRHHSTPSAAGSLALLDQTLRGSNKTRESPTGMEGMPPWGLVAALSHLDQDPSIHEVILSGGDPLTVDDSLLAELVHRVSKIEHVRRLRLHSRMPIVIPQRVTDDLLAWAGKTRLTVLMVLHVNHPAEIDRAVTHSIARLVDAGIPLLSQSVLLRGVNDQADVLAELFERLVDLRVMPYYLHQLDRVAGAAHFEVSKKQGLELIRELRTKLPGYAVPRYVRDIPGNPSKHVLA